MKIYFASFLLLAACGGAAPPAASAERPSPLPTPPVTATAEPPAPPTFEGTYLLDAEATLASMEPAFAQMPPEQRDETRKIARSLFEAMQMTMELRTDGTMSVRGAIPDGDKTAPPKRDDQEGTWKKVDDGIVVTSKGKDMHCTKSGVRLTCEETPPAKEGAVVFVQQR